MKHRIHFITILLFLALLTGCAAPAPAASGSEPATETRTISHAMGETAVPVEPQRVVVLDTGETDNALALGANVVGAPVGDVQAYQGYLSDQLDGIADTGTISEPNLETIVSLEPDLILGSKQRYEEIYDQLAQIAPTVFSESLRVPWQENFLLHAEALGKTDAADALLADYDARAAQIQEALGEDPPAISIVRFRPGQVRLYLKSSYIGYILQDVGLPRPPAQDQDVFSSEISLEQIADVDADYIFVTGYAQDDSEMDAFLLSELWQTLDAVQNERVLDVNDDHWIAGLGVQGANLVLDDLIEILGLEITAESASTTAAATTLSCEPGFRPFVHFGGETCVPENPQRIVTTQDQNGLLPLLELGVKPVGSAGQLLDDGTGRFRRVQGYDTAGIEFIGGYWGESNVESIALLQPDLIVSHEFAADFYDLHSQVAPTVMIQIFDRPLDEVLMDFADLVGRTERAEELRAEYTARVEGLLDALGDRKEIMSISVITAGNNPGEFYRADTGQALGTVMNDLNLLRPAPQQGEGSFDAFSLENLPAHDADVVLVINYAGEDQDPNFDAFINSPIFTALAASQAGQVYVIDGTQTVGAAWGKMNTFIGELERILLNPDLDVDVVQE